MEAASSTAPTSSHDDSAQPGIGAAPEVGHQEKDGSQPRRQPRRRIRCKMCRQELAGREQILRHGLDAEIENAETEAKKEVDAATSANEGVGKVQRPILNNPACSGYFVEPLKWMDPFLQAGEHQGKIIFPNPRCKAKLGNFDWSGVGCGCREWVTPGFCINRSKVDEVTIV